MLKIIFFVCIGASLSFYIYGVLFKILNTELNECQMTYMFENPHFVRIRFNENSLYPKYGLYAYTEGFYVEKIQHNQYNGSPVIFIPGNGGSYKQVRSLASVALRKAIDMKWRKSLDYFAVDLNEELSGTFGGYLNDQKNFVKLCILTVLKLYKNLENKPNQVILIGHSMGGKIAQSLLADDHISQNINTIITLATPVDEPVINLDFYINAFYDDINNYLLKKRTLIIVKNETNFCKNPLDSLPYKNDINNKMPLDDKLIISIGGGSRDFLVHEGLTNSKFSDISVVTTSIPNVWVSTDHLCAVWCLQLIRVINRFLFSLVPFHKGRNYHRQALNFIEDKSIKLIKAEQYFLNPSPYYTNEQDDFRQILAEEADWFEDSRRNFVEYFPSGIKKTRIQMIRLLNHFIHALLSIETKNIDVDDWIFGCSATEVSGVKRFCSKLTRIPYSIEKLPSTHNIYGIIDNLCFITLDLEKIKQNRPDWTHVLLYIRPSSNKMKFNINIYGKEDHSTTIHLPERQYLFNKKFLSLSKTSFHKILLPEIVKDYQSLQLTVKPNSKCSTLAKICVPWIKSCNRYRALMKENRYSVEVYTTSSKPSKYDSSLNPVTVELLLDPKCEYNISIENSFGGTASRIFQQYYHKFPSYGMASLLLILQYQISMKSDNKLRKFPTIPLVRSYFLLVVAVTMLNLLSKFEMFFLSSILKNESFMITLTMSGATLAIIQIFLILIWMKIIFSVQLFRLVSSVITKLKIQSLLQGIPLFPVISFLIVLFALISCGGAALCCACVLYFLLLVQEYKTHSEITVQSCKLLKDRKNSIKEENNHCNHSKIIEQTNIFDNLKDKNSEIDDLIKQTLSDKNLERKIKNENADYNLLNEQIIKIRLHLTLFTMLVLLTALNIPSTICWIKNLRHAVILNADPSLRPTVFTLISLFLIWQLPLPKNINIWHPFNWLCHLCTLFSIIYCQDLVFWLNFLISFIFVTFAMLQMGT